MPNFLGCRCCGTTGQITLRVLNASDGSEVWARNDGSVTQYNYVHIDDTDTIWTPNQGVSKFGLKRWTVADKLKSTSALSYLYAALPVQNNFAQSDSSGNVYFLDTEVYFADIELVSLAPDGTQRWSVPICADKIADGWIPSPVTILLKKSSGVIVTAATMSKGSSTTMYIEAWDASGTRTATYTYAADTTYPYDTIPTGTAYLGGDGKFHFYRKNGGIDIFSESLSLDSSISFGSPYPDDVVGIGPDSSGAPLQVALGSYFGGIHTIVRYDEPSIVFTSPKSFLRWRFVSVGKLYFQEGGTTANVIKCMDLSTGSVLWSFTETVGYAYASAALCFSANENYVAIYGLLRDR